MDTWIGEATKYPAFADITSSAAVESGPRAFGEAGISPREIDVAMIYDSFSITVLCILEDLGFCKKGEGAAWIADGRLGMIEPPGGLRSTQMEAGYPPIIRV